MDGIGRDVGFRPLQVYEQVAEQIRSEIRAGRFGSDTRLPSERELAILFSVGRPAVREAIGALQNEGLVLTRRNSGTYVSPTAVHLLAENALVSAESKDADLSPIATLNVRMILEPAIARLAAKQAKPNFLAEQYLSQMESLSDPSDDKQRMLWSESDRLFHRQLAMMTEDPLIIKIADEIAKSMDQPLWKRLKEDGIYEQKRIKLYVSEHRLIYEAIINGDEDAAAFYVEQHLRRVYRDIAPQE